MNYDKVINEMIKTNEKNKDFFLSFKKLRDCCEETDFEEVSSNLINLMNRLCVKSKRYMIKARLEDDQDQLGINSKGLGQLNSWSSNLTTFSSRWSHLRHHNLVIKVLKSDWVFKELLQNVHKNSVPPLKKLRKFYLNKEIGEGINEDFKIETKMFKMRFRKDGKVRDLIYIENGIPKELDTVIKFNRSSSSSYGFSFIDAIDGRKIEELEEREIFLQEFSTKNLNLPLNEFKILLFLYGHKKHIKDMIENTIKQKRKDNKGLVKENKLIMNILNPLLVVEKL